MPAMPSRGVERECRSIERFGIEPDASANPALPRHTDAFVAFLDLDLERISRPAHRAWADRDRIGIAIDGGTRSLGHRPACLGSVERHVECRMVDGIAAPALAIVGREDAAEEGDDRQAVLPSIGTVGVARRVDVPPAVATGWNRRVEARSCITVRAASCPDKAAIGTPAPGWVLPPAQ